MENLRIPCLVDISGNITEISEPLLKLGRASDNQVVLNSNRVSRYHAQIKFDGLHYTLVDLGSKNGTWLNRELVENERPLRDGDLITVGNVHFTFRTTGENIETVSDKLAGAVAARLRLDSETRELWLDDKLVEPPLSLLEWRLIEVLYQNQGKVCSRDSIIEAVYQTQNPEEIPFDNALETLVSRLRKRLNMNDATKLPRLKTVRGVGYKLEI